MYIRLCCYLYAIFLICVSSSSFALSTISDLERAKLLGGFAYSTYCSDSTKFEFCINVEEEDAIKKSCQLKYNEYSAIATTVVYTGQINIIMLPQNSASVASCSFPYKINNSNRFGESSTLVKLRSGVCPVRDSPPPELIKFARQGRWINNELSEERCYKNCSYTNGRSFTYKHYVYTNGIITEFTEADRLKSQAKFCDIEPEPKKDLQDEVTYDSSCEDAVFKQICDFINWFRNDGELIDPPDVKSENLDIPANLDYQIININMPENTTCFPDYDFNLNFLGKEIKHTFSFSPICNGLESFNNLLRALYLMHAALIIFRK